MEKLQFWVFCKTFEVYFASTKGEIKYKYEKYTVVVLELYKINEIA